MIHMQVSSKYNVLDKVNFLVGSDDVIRGMEAAVTRKPFNDEAGGFLNDLSLALNKKNVFRMPDIATLAFWIRKASVMNLKKRFNKEDGYYHLGRGILFHISPSNVPVNFAYSLIAGLLTGNANIVRVPSKKFEQVDIIVQAINETLCDHENMRAYIALVRYERDKEINDFFSQMADVRIVWGGDETIAELRKSPIGSRATEVTFADRYSLAVIDSDKYLEAEEYEKVAQDFYNDTYLTDQNACTSPFLVAWMGKHKEEAKEIFWEKLHELVKEKYTFQDIQAVNKLTNGYLAAVNYPDAQIIRGEDNLVVRVNVDRLDGELFECRDNSGFFFEYNCEDIKELASVCNNNKCQTIGYYGDKNDIMPLLECGIRGVDRIVPIGKTMEFDLIWDGYDLSERFTRTISIL